MPEKSQILQKAAAMLSEHFDSIVILGSFKEDGQTKGTQWTEGNVYAAYGQAIEYVKRIDNMQRMNDHEQFKRDRE